MKPKLNVSYLDNIYTAQVTIIRNEELSIKYVPTFSKRLIKNYEKRLNVGHPHKLLTIRTTFGIGTMISVNLYINLANLFNKMIFLQYNGRLNDSIISRLHAKANSLIKNDPDVANINKSPFLDPFHIFHDAYKLNATKNRTISYPFGYINSIKAMLKFYPQLKNTCHSFLSVGTPEAARVVHFMTALGGFMEHLRYHGDQKVNISSIDSDNRSLQHTDRVFYKQHHDQITHLLRYAATNHTYDPYGK